MQSLEGYYLRNLISLEVTIMKLTIIFSIIAVVLLVSASFTEWKDVSKKLAGFSSTQKIVKNKYDNTGIRYYAYKKGGSPRYEINEKTRAPKESKPIYTPIHQREWFILIKEIFGVLANFIQTIGGIISAILAIVLFGKNRKLEQAKAES